MDGLGQPRRGLGSKVLAALSPLLFLYALLSFLTLDRAPDFGMRQRLFHVVSVQPGGPAHRAGIAVGDRIVSQNGIPTEDTMRLLEEYGRIRPGDPVDYRVERGGEILSLTTVARHIPRTERLRIVARTAVAVAFLLIGLLVYGNRTDRVGTLYYLVGVCFAVILIQPPHTGSVALQLAIKSLRDASLLFLAPLFLHFFLRFPYRKKRPRWILPLRRFGPFGFPLYVFSLAVLIPSIVLDIRAFTAGTLHPSAMMILQIVIAFYLFACFLGGIAVFFHSYAKTRDPATRRKLRGVLVGTSVGLLPMALFNIVRQALPEMDLSLSPFLILLTLLLPLSFAHAIVRHGLLDVELIVKRSVLYTVLTTFLAMAYLVFVDIVSRLLRTVTGSTDLPATLLSIFLIALLFSPARELIQRWVDRTFYRDKYAHRQTLHDFSKAVTAILDLNTLLRMMVDRLSAGLHIPKVGVLLLNGDASAHVLRAETGIGSPSMCPEIQFSSSGAIPRLLREKGTIVPVESIPEYAGPNPLSDDERVRLKEMESSLLLPLLSGEELVGIVSLSRKRSGDICSHEDRQLLRTLANHAALAIENAKLHKSTVEKERMEQELRLAREIQTRFLPTTKPDLPEIEIAGVNAPCEEIGGDYYDYIVTGHRSLGVAIGDAAGSGVPAALLMAGVHAAFRAQAMAIPSPGQVLQELNQFSYKQQQTARFVTFFFGRIDVKSGLLRYSNAGHPPPLWVSREGETRFLRDADLILGIQENVVYHEHAFQLGPGDLVLLYTDGLTDELNPDDESFGEERLRKFTAKNRHLPPAELCDLILSEVTEFMGGDVMDDVTLLAFRYR